MTIQEELEGHPALVSLLAGIVRQAFKVEVTVYHHKYWPAQVFIGRTQEVTP